MTGQLITAILALVLAVAAVCVAASALVEVHQLRDELTRATIKETDMDLIGLVVLLILVGLAFWAVGTLAGPLHLPPPVVVVVQVFLVLVTVLYLVRVLFGRGPVLPGL